MNEIPILSGKAVVSTLCKLRFLAVRTKRSHVIRRHPDGRKTVVPLHGNRDISRPLLLKIPRQAEIGTKEFLDAP